MYVYIYIHIEVYIKYIRIPEYTYIPEEVCMISTISAMTIALWWCSGSGASRAVPAKALDSSNAAIGRHVCTQHNQHPHPQLTSRAKKTERSI